LPQRLGHGQSRHRFLGLPLRFSPNSGRQHIRDITHIDGHQGRYDGISGCFREKGEGWWAGTSGEVAVTTPNGSVCVCYFFTPKMQLGNVALKTREYISTSVSRAAFRCELVPPRDPPKGSGDNWWDVEVPA